MMRRPPVFIRALGILAASLFCAAAGPPQAQAGPDTHRKSEAEIAAEERFHDFVSAYREHDFQAQWQIVDPRKRYWVKLGRWRTAMQQSQRRHGELAELTITHVLSADAKQIPCTEMGHCFRKGVPYVVLMLRTRYERKQVPQPEFAVMSMSDEGWRWAGGTFPATALGETAVLLDEADDKKFLAMQRNRSRR
jgi:hypothetical protein